MSITSDYVATMLLMHENIILIYSIYVISIYSMFLMSMSGYEYEYAID